MLKILLIFIILSAQPLFLVSKRKQRFEVALPVCCMFDTLILTAFGMVFKNLTAGVIVVCILAALSLIAAVFIERKALLSFFIKTATPGFLAWCAGYCLIWAFSYRFFFTWWDDFMHWGVFVKQIFLTNQLYTEPGIQVLMHQNYPPAVSVFEYMFTNIWGAYSEPVVFAAHKILLYTCLLPFTKFFGKKENAKAVLLALSAFFFMFIWARINIYTIYIDTHVSAMFALYLFFAVFENKNPLRVIFASIIGMCLTLTKVTGIEFALAGMGVYAVLGMMDLNKEKLTKLKRSDILKKACVIILWGSPLIAHAAWNDYTGHIPSELSKVSVSTVLQWLTLRGGDSVDNIISDASYRWFNDSMINGGIMIHNILILAAFIALMYCFRKSEKDKRLSDQYTALMILLPIGYFFYSLSLTVVFIMDDYLNSINGGDSMFSFDRYLVSYAAGMYLILMAIAFRKASVLYNERARSRTLMAGMIVAVVLVMLLPETFLRLGLIGSSYPADADYKKYMRAVQKNQTFVSFTENSENSENFAEEKNDAKIYYVHCIDSMEFIDAEQEFAFFYYIEVEFWKNQYFLKPVKLNAVTLRGMFYVNNTDSPYFRANMKEPINPFDKFNDGAQWGLSLTDGGFSHVLLNYVNDDFRDKFFYMFDCAYDQIKDDTLYEVVVTDSKDLPVKLTPVNVLVYAY